MTPEEGKKNIDTVCTVTGLLPNRIPYGGGRLDPVCDAAKGAVDDIRPDGTRCKINPGACEAAGIIEPPEETPTFGGAEDVKSPLAIDLDGDGIATYALKNGVFFDIDADGFAEATGWLNNKDAFLVLDRNKNGIIDDASELFGDLTAENGFEALKALDSNGDGIIDANDAGWEELMLWVDAVNDGVSQSEELISVADAGIERIELNYQNQELTDENGNEHRQTATVHWQDGHTTVIEDIWFQTNQALSFDTQVPDLTDEEWEKLSVLPYIEGFGNVSATWIAMSKDAVLKDMVKEYCQADNATRADLLDNLIYQWTGSADVDPYSRDPNKAGYGHVMDARQLVSLEHLIGEDYLGTWCWGELDPNPHNENFAKLASVAYFCVVRCSKSRLTVSYVFDFCATTTLKSTTSTSFAKLSCKAAPLLIAEYNKFKDYVIEPIAA